MPEPTLRSRAAKGFTWNALGSLVRAGLGFSINILLARLLGPEPFGILALWLTILGLGNLVIESGISNGLIQRRTLSTQDIRLIYGWQMLAGLVLAGLLALLAQPLAWFFKQPALPGLMPWLSLTLFLTAMAQVPSALLRRELDFKALQLGQILSYVAGFAVVGLPLAFLGAGLWSLIAAQAVQALVNMVWVFVKVGRGPSPSLRGDRSLLTFGVRSLGANLVNWLGFNFDTLVIGRLFGAASLGVYNRISFLIGTPLGILTTSIQTILLSSVARIQSDTRLVRSVYLSVLELTSAVALPAFFCVAMVGHTFIEAIYGERWLSGVPLVQPLALLMAVGALSMLPGPVLTALGRVDLELRQSAISLLLTVPLLLVLSRISVVAVAWGVVAARLGFLVLLNGKLWSSIGLDLRTYLAALLRPVLLASALALLAYGLDSALSGLPALVRLASVAALLVTSYAVVFLAAPALLLTADARGLLMEIAVYKKVWSLWPGRRGGEA